MDKFKLLELRCRIEKLKLQDLSDEDKEKIKKIENRLDYGYHPSSFKSNSQDSVIALIIVLTILSISFLIYY